jgi:hypothetical protein
MAWEVMDKIGGDGWMGWNSIGDVWMAWEVMDGMEGDGWMDGRVALCNSEVHAPEGTLCRSSFTFRWAG